MTNRFGSIDYIGRTIYPTDINDGCECCVSDEALITAATLRSFVREYGDLYDVPLDAQNDFLEFCCVLTDDVSNVEAEQLMVLSDIVEYADSLMQDIKEDFGLFSSDVDTLEDLVNKLQGLL